MPLAMVVLAYLIGSIPFGLLIAKLGWGVDPRSAGSGNIGFTNVYRVAGTTPAVLTLIGDAGKGLGPVLAAHTLLLGGLWPFLIGLAAIIGHDYSCFLKGRGGKGVATSFGALFGLHLPVASLTLITWIGVVAVSRRVSIASVVAFGTLPFWAVLLPFTSSRLISLIGAAMMTALVLIRHRDNLRRLRQGLEVPLD